MAGRDGCAEQKCAHGDVVISLGGDELARSFKLTHHLKPLIQLLPVSLLLLFFFFKKDWKKSVLEQDHFGFSLVGSITSHLNAP